MVKSLLRRPGVQALLARLIAAYLGFALGTTRWRLEGAEHLAPVLASGRAVAAFWHKFLPLMPALFRRARAVRLGCARRCWPAAMPMGG